MKGTSPAGYLRFAAYMVCFAWSAACPTAAADQKPDIILKSKAASISVTLDPAIKANVNLANHLIADGRKWANDNFAEANKQLKESPEFFREGRNWKLERAYAIQSVVARRYISILHSDYVFTGGAHPNRNFDTTLWDDQDKKPISIRPFFSELKDNGTALKAILKAVIASLVAEKKERGTYFPEDTSWQGYLEPKLLKIGPVLFAPSTDTGKSSGLVFQYAPYAVGAYAEGSYEAFVPWTMLKPFLSPEGVAIFGGERPPETGKSEK